MAITKGKKFGLRKKKVTTKSAAAKKAPVKKAALKKSATKKPAEKESPAADTQRKYRKNVAEPSVNNPAAAAVKKLRGSATLADFAKQCGLQHAPAVARVEREDYYSTSVKTLLQIAEACDKKLVITFKDA